MKKRIGYRGNERGLRAASRAIAPRFGFPALLIRDDAAAVNSEYAVLFAVVAVAGFLTVWILRTQIDGTYACVAR